MGSIDISNAEARRIALAAQGFDRSRRSGRVTLGQVRQAVQRLGLLQIDSVNVLVQAHYLVLFSRLGSYERAHLDQLLYQRRELTEQWAHEASIVPVESWGLLRHRMETHRVRPYGFESFLEQNPEYVAWVLQQVRERGPLSADELPEPEGMSRRMEIAWFGTVPRAVLEALFGQGVLAVAGRRSNQARLYDLVERVLAAEHCEGRMEREEAQRELLRQAARNCGVGTMADLADYYRMPVTEARERLRELVVAGELQTARVEGWRETAYLHPEARAPRRMAAATLLSPFDPVVWFRPRAERLFNFEYRIEIYTPEKKRRWGYYVLPFLLGDRLVARVDLKADRVSRRLLAPAVHLEAGADPEPVAAALAAELRAVADWLNLEDVTVGTCGDFAKALSAAVRRAAAVGVP